LLVRVITTPAVPFPELSFLLVPVVALLLILGSLIAVLAGIVSSVLPQIFSYENTLPKSNFRGILWLSRQTSNKLEGCNYA
jgi:hypothetical protein